jgi:hypothetical protein
MTAGMGGAGSAVRGGFGGARSARPVGRPGAAPGTDQAAAYAMRRTLTGAAAMDYPHKTVWLLDEKRRPEMRALCDELANVLERAVIRARGAMVARRLRLEHFSHRRDDASRNWTAKLTNSSTKE